MHDERDMVEMETTREETEAMEKVDSTSDQDTSRWLVPYDPNVARLLWLGSPSLGQLIA